MGTASNILGTIEMISEDRPDIRTMTMGTSLLGCADSDGGRVRRHCCEHIVRRAADLVSVCEMIEAGLGIPIINRRVSVAPITPMTAASRKSNLTPRARMLDEAAAAIDIGFIGGFSALIEGEAAASDLTLIDSVPEALPSTKVVCSSVNVGSSRAGISTGVVRAIGEAITASARVTENGLGAAKLVVFANSVGDNPLMADAFHGVEMPDCVVSVGVSDPGAVTRAITPTVGEPFDTLAETVKKSAFKITRMGELVERMAAERLEVDFGVANLSLAPTSEIGDSVAYVLGAMGLECVSAHGTTAALALLNDAVKRDGLIACPRVDGLSGLFIPVSGDEGMIEVAEVGAISLVKLEAMTAICSVSLDMIAVPGGTPSSTIARMIAGEAAIGVMNHKTTTMRIIPTPGTAPDDVVKFGGLLGRTPVMSVSPYSNEAFIGQEGLMPTPVHGFKN